ncbi:hypothetical protein CRUP_028063 [Coryphaenoides rupestris]|nr:hypothetical protein CRUP_028063 [Coryphaenoides rupestris]
MATDSPSRIGSAVLHSQPHKAGCLDQGWEDLLSVCLLRTQEPGGQPTLVEIPLFGQAKLGELLTSGAPRPTKLPFTLTAVDGCREDDISVVLRAGVLVRSKDKVGHEWDHSTFRHLFRAERCPATFVHGSLYCFHCSGTDTAAVAASATAARVKCRPTVELERKPLEHALSLSTFLCSHVEGGDADIGGGEEEEKLVLIGKLTYQLILTMWRLLCLCYYADARLEVLKLTKHAEDGTIKARWRVMEARPPLLPKVSSLLAGALVALGLQEHRPALNLLPLFFTSRWREGRP